jgi:hypothetical protein
LSDIVPELIVTAPSAPVPKSGAAEYNDVAVVLSSVPEVGIVTEVAAVAVNACVNAPKNVTAPPSVSVLLPLLTPVPPPDAPRVPQAGAAPLPAVMSACPDVPNPIVPELASVVPRFVLNPHAPEALMTCALAAVAPHGK